MKVKLTNIRVASQNKEGQPYLDKNGRPYQRIGIQTEQHVKEWLGGLAYQGSPALNWKVGDEVEIEIVQNGKYLNFNLPRQQNQGIAPIMTELRNLHEKVDKILELITKVDDEQPQINPDELPF